MSAKNWKETDVVNVEQPGLTMAERTYLPQIAAGLKTTLLRHFFKKSARDEKVIEYPEQTREVSNKSNYRGLHRLNKDEQGRVACVACFMCSTACPVHCIHIEGAPSPWDDREKYPEKFDIDELRCIYCGMCEEACPVDAIELTPLFHLVGKTRDEMILDKAKLLAIFDETKDDKPRKGPAITGY